MLAYAVNAPFDPSEPCELYCLSCHRQNALNHAGYNAIKKRRVNKETLKPAEIPRIRYSAVMKRGHVAIGKAECVRHLDILVHDNIFVPHVVKTPLRFCR